MNNSLLKILWENYRTCTISKNDAHFYALCDEIIHEIAEDKKMPYLEEFLSENRVLYTMTEDFLSRIDAICEEDDTLDLLLIRSYLLCGNGWKYLYILQYFKLEFDVCKLAYSLMSTCLFTLLEDFKFKSNDKNNVFMSSQPSVKAVDVVVNENFPKFRLQKFGKDNGTVKQSILDSFGNYLLRGFDKTRVEVNFMEFNILVLNLFEKVIWGPEAALCSNRDSMVLSTIKFCLDRIYFFGFGAYSSSYDYIIFRLINLLLSSIGELSKCIGECSEDYILVNFEFLRLLRKIKGICGNKIKAEANPRYAEYAYALTFGISAFYLQILRRSTFHHQLPLFHQLYTPFVASMDGTLVVQCIATFTHNFSPRKVISLLVAIVTRYKIARRRSQRRISANGANHCNLCQNVAQPCLITTTFYAMLKFLKNCSHDYGHSKIFDAWSLCGVCCCMNLQHSMRKLLSFMKKSGIRTSLLKFLRNRFFRDLGLYDEGCCQVCSGRWKGAAPLDVLGYLNQNGLPHVLVQYVADGLPNFNTQAQKYILRCASFTIKSNMQAEETNKVVLKYCFSVLSCKKMYECHPSEAMELDSVDMASFVRDPDLANYCWNVFQARILYRIRMLEGTGMFFTPALVENASVYELRLLIVIFDECYDEITAIAGKGGAPAPEPLLLSRRDYAELKRALAKLYAASKAMDRLLSKSAVIKSYFKCNVENHHYDACMYLVFQLMDTDINVTDGVAYMPSSDEYLNIIRCLMMACLEICEDSCAIKLAIRPLLDKAVKDGKISIQQVCCSWIGLDDCLALKDEKEEECSVQEFPREVTVLQSEDLQDEEYICMIEVDIANWMKEDIQYLDDSAGKSNVEGNLVLSPKVCAITLELTNLLDSHAGHLDEEIFYCLKSVSTACQMNREVCFELNEQKLVEKLLKKLRCCLNMSYNVPDVEGSTENHHYQLCCVILELISQLFRYKTETFHLRGYFDTLKADNAAPIYSNFMEAMLNVADSENNDQPVFYLRFPAKVAASNSGYVSDCPAEALALSMRDLHRQTTLPTPWGICAAFLPVDCLLGWSIWQNGFSLSFWFCSLEGVSRETLLLKSHILSIGYDTFSFEIWLDDTGRCFSIELTRPEGNSFEILSTVSFSALPITSKWHHVFVSGRHVLKQQKMGMEVIFVLDGKREEKQFLHFSTIFTRKVRPACIMIGETRSSTSPYCTTNFTLFRTWERPRECAATLRSLGPNATNVITCEKGNFLAFGKGAEEPDWRADETEKRYDAIMEVVRENILLSYASRDPKTFSYYSSYCFDNSPVSMFPPSTPALLRKNRSGEKKASRLTCHSNCAIILAHMDARCNESAASAVLELGGVQFLAYLFAWIVGKTELPRIRALALRLLLTFSQSNVRLHNQFQDNDMCHLIGAVIMGGCKSGVACGEILEVVLDCSCNKGGLLKCVNGVLRVDEKGDGLFLTNAVLIVDVVFYHFVSWDHTVVTCLFKALQTLVKESHPFQAFNVKQLEAVDFVSVVLNIFKDKFLLKDGMRNEPDVCYAALDFLRSMISSSVHPFTHIKAMIEYLCVTHPDSWTYVVHTKSSFYFIFDSIHRGNSNMKGVSAKTASQPISSTFGSSLRRNSLDSGIMDWPGECFNIKAEETPAHLPSVEGKTCLEWDDCNIVAEGLMTIMRDIVRAGSDDEKLYLDVDPKIFLVLVNHPNCKIRMVAVETLLSFLMRYSEEECLQFVAGTNGYHHLANQLSAHETTVDLVNCCLALLSKCRWFTMEEFILPGDVVFPTLDLVAIPPTLALLPKSVNNIPLARNLMAFLKALILELRGSLKKLTDNGVVECLFKTVIACVHSEDYNPDETLPLLMDVCTFFASLVNICLANPGSYYIQTWKDVIYKCRYFEAMEEAHCGIENECFRFVHNMHCSILSVSLNEIAALFDSYQEQDAMSKSRSSFFTSLSNSRSPSMSSFPSSATLGSSSTTKIKQFPKNDLFERCKLVVRRCTEYLLFIPMVAVTEKDLKLATDTFHIIINGLSNALSNKPSILRSLWSSPHWLSKETLKLQGANLMIWMLAPDRPDQIRMYVIETLLNDPAAKHLTSCLVLSNPEIERRFVVFLWHLMYAKSSKLSESFMKICVEMKTSLISWNIISSQSLGHSHDHWQFEVASVVKELCNFYWDLEKSQRASVNKCVHKWNLLSKNLEETALCITHDVAAFQAMERKKFLNWVKNKYSLSDKATEKWRQIMKQMTHERAPWFHEESYPKNWELDFTEGPLRLRKRLRRCHLNMEQRFLKSEYLPGINTVADPLSYLFSKTTNLPRGSNANNISPVVNADEKISYMCFATNVQLDKRIDGELLLGDKNIYFIDPEHEGSFTIPLESIKELHNRRFDLKEKAFEIFLQNGNTYLISFKSESERINFMNVLSNFPLPNRLKNDMLLSDAVEMWRYGHVTNLEYLITLNKMAGRSYNDLMQYPIMPFILACYEGDSIDISDPKNYRNLKKPMAVQNKSKEEHFINHYNDLKYSRVFNECDGRNLPYHYSSHYSNTGTVLHFLVRLPPFTQMFLKYQDNNFDLPDRMFHSLETSWRLASCESTTDVKELIPEFFYLPEFLKNESGFYLGKRQNGENIDDVKLPPWAKGDARLFILCHAQMLESEFVRENLPHWIDLVFGYKQRGKAAVDAINVFHPATYGTFDAESNLANETEKNAWQTMVRNYGQMPRQLFHAPHPMMVQNLMRKEYREGALGADVMPSVKGLKWGNYAGSPNEPALQGTWSMRHSKPVASFVPLLTNDVFGLAHGTSILLCYNKERSANLVNEGVALLGAALLSWNHADGIIRLKQRKEQPLLPVLLCSYKDAISICATTPDSPFVWVGMESGNILVYKYKFDLEMDRLDFTCEPTTLIAHTSKIRAICISPQFFIVVSCGEDGLAIVWDLNKLTYIRTLSQAVCSVSLACISNTMGDICTVCIDEANKNNVLQLHTINGARIGSLNENTDEITAVCFSAAPEGISVNVILVGFKNGSIRMWSTWDLLFVGEIDVSFDRPVLGLAYSYDCQHLYASDNDGNVVIFEGKSSAVNKSTRKTPKFLNLSTSI